MRDPIEGVKIRLREAGAVYRGGGTKTRSDWLFPDGEVFEFERKANNPTIDARVATRKLNQVLARRAGQVKEPAPRVNGKALETPMPIPVETEAIPVLDTPASTSMRERWTAALAQAEAYQEKLLADAQVAERRVHMLKAMIPYIDDPTFADTVRSVLPSLEPPPAQPIVVLPPPPPQQIGEHIQVTRDLVFAATHTFDDTFTVNNVVDCMINGREVTREERLRIRSSIASCVVALGERGQLVRDHQGIGRQQSIWKRSTPEIVENVPAS